MKKILLIVCFICQYGIIAVSAQDSNGDGFHDGDVAGLNKILNDNPSNTLGWSGTDYGSWTGVTWSSDNPKRIQELNVNGKSLESIDLSVFVKLLKIVCNDNSLTSIDISNNLLLTRLFCDNNQITTLNLSSNTTLNQLYCNNNEIETISIPTSHEFDLLDCRNNRLPFSQINILIGNSIENRFPQKDLYKERIVYVNQEIDLSAEETINSVNTVFVWKKDGNTISGATTSKYTPTSIGVYTCEMTNTEFSGQTLITNNITVQVNDNEPVITTTTLSVPENSANATTVGTIEFTDADPVKNPATYSITDATNTFEIGEVDGVIKVKSNTLLNKEVTPTIDVTVNVNDGKFSDNETVTITISNVNENPTALQLSNNQVTENVSVGTSIGTFTTTDVDNGDTFTYTFASGGTDNSSFRISGNALQTNTDIDFETKDSYSVKIRTTDNGDLFYEENFTITVSGINEAPENIQLTNNSVQENMSSGTDVGTISSTDQDTGDGVTYTFASGGTDNNSFQITGNVLKTNSTFDYETKKTYTVRIKAEDNGGLSSEKDINISVTNKNEQPDNLQITNNRINENVSVGTVIGQLSVTDVDEEDSFTFTFASGGIDNSSFQISGNSLKTNTDVDFETKSSYTIKIRGTDNGGLFTESDLTITVNNINDKPSELKLSENCVDENCAKGTEIGVFSATDTDAGDTFTYSFTGTDNDNAAFAISGDKLLVEAKSDYEGKNSYAIRVKVTDNGGEYIEKEFTISITDINERPTDISVSNVEVLKNIVTGTEVAVISGIDPDSGDQLSFEISDNDHFQIQGNKLIVKSGFEDVDYKEYGIAIDAIDNSGLRFTEDFTMLIKDISTNVDNREALTINIYPNPVKSFFIIESDNTIESIIMYNTGGRIISRYNVWSDSYIVNTDNLQSGIYIININTLSGEITRKIMKL
jgi:hypothetical protein